LRKGAVIYCTLWTLTALFGLPDVDRKFDVDFAIGSQGFGVAGKRQEVVPVMRIPFSTSLRNPEVTPDYVPDKPWRARSAGLAIAPFLVIDEVAAQTHVLAGLSGHRLVFWFFGFSRWILIKTYWVS
jgi:hypothetical protein